MFKFSHGPENDGYCNFTLDLSPSLSDGAKVNEDPGASMNTKLMQEIVYQVFGGRFAKLDKVNLDSNENKVIYKGNWSTTQLNGMFADRRDPQRNQFVFKSLKHPKNPKTLNSEHSQRTFDTHIF